VRGKAFTGLRLTGTGWTLEIGTGDTSEFYPFSPVSPNITINGRGMTGVLSGFLFLPFSHPL